MVHLTQASPGQENELKPGIKIHFLGMSQDRTLFHNESVL